MFGVIFEADGWFGMGCLARDGTGRLMEAFMLEKVGKVQPEIAETIGIKEALSWIDRHSWSNVFMETDSLVCVQAINSTMFMPSHFIFKNKNAEYNEHNIRLCMIALINLVLSLIQLRKISLVSFHNHNL